MGNAHYQKWVEMQGYYLRQYLRLSSYAKLDHLALAAAMNVKILSVRDVPSFRKLLSINYYPMIAAVGRLGVCAFQRGINFEQ